MGYAKRLMEHHDEQRGVATMIAIQAGVLRQCEMHEDFVFEGGKAIESAYKLGNSKFSAGEFKGIFEERKEMTDCIKAAVEDHPASSCLRCAKLMED